MQEPIKDQLDKIGQDLNRISTEAGRIRARIYSQEPISTLPPKRPFPSTMPPHQPGERFSLAREISPYKNK